jgi:hypothetical protein
MCHTTTTALNTYEPLRGQKRPRSSLVEDESPSRTVLVESTLRPVKVARQLPKSVRFAATKQVRERFHSPQEIQHCWLDHEAYDEIKRDNFQTLKAVLRAHGRISQLDTTRHCARGLEGAIAAIVFSNKAYHTQKTFQKVILREQDELRRTGRVDATHALCALSVCHSMRDRTRAIRLAEMDNKQL